MAEYPMLFIETHSNLFPNYPQ
jgi:hypothetical protein